MQVHRVGHAWLDSALSAGGLELVDGIDAEGLVTVAPPVELRSMAELEPEAWLGVFAANAEEPFFAAQPWLRAALERGSGSWVAILPALGTRPFPGGGPAGTAAACLQTLVRVAATEGGPAGVRANVVATGWLDGAAPSALDTELAVADTPLGRLAVPGNVAAAAAWLLSAEAGHVTGEIIHVDGGYTLSGGSRPDPRMTT